MKADEISGLIETIAALFAVIGGIYAAYKFWSSRKSRVKVSLRRGFLTFHPPYHQELSDDMLIVTIGNDSEKSVTIASIDITFKRKYMIFRHIPGETHLPHKLMPGDAIKFWYPIQTLRADFLEHGETGNLKIKGRIRDVLGKKYLSNGFRLQIGK